MDPTTNKYAAISLHIAYRVNVTVAARTLLHERTQTGARSTANIVKLRARTVFVYCLEQLGVCCCHAILTRL